MKKTIVCVSLALSALFCAGADFNAPDLGKLAPEKVKRYKKDALVWISGGKATMPIISSGKEKKAVYYGRMSLEHRAALWLQSAVKEMTGVEVEVIYVPHGKSAPKGPALFVGDVFAAAAGVSGVNAKKEEFRVVMKDGSVYFAGRADFAVYDFAERELGVRQYWEAKDGGRSVVKTDRIVLPDLDYRDIPYYPHRYIWDYERTDWFKVWKCGSSHPIDSQAHVPYTWWKDTNYNYMVTRPEIFELSRDGRRGKSRMMCYSNPKTLQTYKERIDAELKGGPSSGLIMPGTKTVAVVQWDANIDCQCERCKKMYDHKAGLTGNASPIIWGYLARELSDWLAEKYPDYTISFSPYLNTCDLPEGLVFPAKNAECSLCTMPGLAMLKDDKVRAHEEKMMRDWAAATGRPVRSWDYIIWPAEYCKAPYLFGKVAQDHYKRLRDVTVGSFVNGDYPTHRLVLSAYVWMRSMWNPDFDLMKVYDTFAERMFGAGAAPMRKLIKMQEDGWMRPWNVGQISNKNIYEISYPRKDVLEMERLIAEAKKLAKDDELSLKRIAWYEEGFIEFFKESADLATGTALEPSRIQKVSSDPVIDGRLDDEVWRSAVAYPFVREMDRKRSEPYYPADVRLVWTPGSGVTIAYRCSEPNSLDEEFRRKIRQKGAVEMLDTFLDVSGAGDGHYCQIYLEDDARPMFYTDGPKWLGKGVKAAIHFGKGEWSMEIYIPFSSIKDLPGAQYPEGTSSAGKFWLGNFCRARVWDIRLPKEERRPGTKRESTRRYTRYSIWNKDPAAFGKLMFVE